jgi:hypothetical protein
MAFLLLCWFLLDLSSHDINPSNYYYSTAQAVIVYAECLGFPASNFTLVTAFPRRNISELPSESSLKDAGLFPRETVIIKER